MDFAPEAYMKESGAPIVVTKAMTKNMMIVNRTEQKFLLLLQFGIKSLLFRKEEVVVGDFLSAFLECIAFLCVNIK